MMTATPRDYGEFLKKLPWDFYTTLTFKLPVGWETAVRRFDGWIRRLEQRAQGPIGWLRSVERGRQDLIHIHSLIEEPESLVITDLGRAWNWGKSDIQVYDPAREGAHYVAKDIVSERADWDIHLRTPDRRRLIAGLGEAAAHLPQRL